MLQVSGRSIVAFLMLLLSVGYASSEAAGLEEDPFFISRRVVKGPSIDGQADDACWGKVKFYEGFARLGSHEPTKLKTKFKSVYDDSGVYFLFVCEEKRDDLVLSAKKGNGRVWLDSSVEIFVSPDRQPAVMLLEPNGRHYGHFAFNAAGIKFQEIGKNGADAWSPKWHVKTKIDGKQWMAEVKLPFKMILDHHKRKYIPRDLAVWKIQLARSYGQGKSRHLTTFFNAKSRYAEMDRFGSVVFSLSGGEEEIVKQLGWHSLFKPSLDRSLAHAQAIRQGGAKAQASGIISEVKMFERYFKAVKPPRYPSVRERMQNTCDKIEADAKSLHYKMLSAAIGGDADIALVAQPTMKNSAKVLPDFIPPIGRLSKPIELKLCPGEFEPASFVIWADKELSNVTVEVGELKCEQNRNIIPADSVDVRWVKCWYQGGVEGPRHTGKRVLTSELLLKNPELVRVDSRNRKNIFRHKKREGDKVARPYLPHHYHDDAKDLLSVKKLPPRCAQQVWLTARVNDDTPAGVYEGVVTVKADNAKAATIPVRIEVLGFKLKPNPLISGVYCINPIWTRNGPAHEKAILARMKNLVDHGVTHPGIRCETPERLPTLIRRMKKAGLNTDDVFILTWSFWVNKAPDPKTVDPDHAVKLAAKWGEYAKKAGVKQVYLYLADEARGKRLEVQKRYVPKMREMGVKTWVACYQDYFPIAGSFIDAPVLAFKPASKELVDAIHAAGNIVLSYANPQCGSELPETYRRNYGLLLWAVDYDGSMNFSLWSCSSDPWDDFDHSFYRDHNMAYPTKSGVVDTIQWEGWREGVDDCRYMATLLDSIEIAKEQGRIKEAKSARIWVSQLKWSPMTKLYDLDRVRSKMIYHIRKCRGIQ